MFVHCSKMDELYSQGPWHHLVPERTKTRLGLSAAELEQLCTLGKGGLPRDPIYSFRRATQDRFLFYPWSRQFVHLQPCPFALDENENTKLKDTPRQFGEAPKGFIVSAALQKICKTLGALNQKHSHLPAVSDAAAGDKRILVSIHIFEILYDPSAEVTAEVTPEGVHQDGAEHVLVLKLGSENVQEGSARSRVFSLSQELGPAEEESPNELANIELKEPGEAIFLADRLVKHAVTPLLPADPRKPARRRVIVAWSRRPNTADDLTPHWDSAMPAFNL